MITTRTPIAFVLAAAMVTPPGCVHRLGGRPAGVWELRGAVVDASGDRLRVRHKTGQVVEIVLDDRTTVLRNDKPEERSALRRGTRVTVVIEPLAGGAQRARIVRVYGGGP